MSTPATANGIWTAFQALYPFLRPYKKFWLATFIALAIASAATLSLPVAFRYLIDAGFAQNQSDPINQYFIGLLILAMVLAIATALRFYFVSWLGERISADLRDRVYRHIITMSPQFFETAQTGEVLSRLTTDTTLVQTLVGSSVSLGLRNLFMFIGGALMLFVTSQHLAGYIAITLLLVIAPILVFGRQVRRLSRDSQERVADASALAGEVLNAMTTVQAYGQEQREAQRFRDAVEVAFQSGIARTRARAWLTVLVILLVFSAVTFVLWLGAHAVLAGEMSAGQLSQFILYAVITAGAIGTLSEVWGELQRALGAIERLLELLHTQSPVQTPAQPLPLPEPTLPISLQNITFAYPSRPDSPALSAFSLHIENGEHIALVGPSGAGKTTVFQLLMRLYDQQQGTIKINGVDIKTLSLNDARKPYSVVLQDSVIFAGTVFDNICYGNPQASFAQVEQAAQMAAAAEFIADLPQGYQTFLGERGVRLSGGQRQRIAIARAILSDPEILLLDEATSALDAASEHQVQQALNNAAQNRTTLVIAHRLATVKAVNRIIVMDQGQIVAQGSHQQLLQSSPLYARLAALQFSEHI